MSQIESPLFHQHFHPAPCPLKITRRYGSSSRLLDARAASQMPHATSLCISDFNILIANTEHNPNPFRRRPSDSYAYIASSSCSVYNHSCFETFYCDSLTRIEPKYTWVKASFLRSLVDAPTLMRWVTRADNKSISQPCQAIQRRTVCLSVNVCTVKAAVYTSAGSEPAGSSGQGRAHGLITDQLP